MKFMHLSDLHIGKRVNEYSMIEDQKEILRQIIMLADEEKPDGILIAGDIYDKNIPVVEAVNLFDWFLTLIAKRKIPVFLISGNHDSAERLAFGRELMKESRIYIANRYEGKIERVELEDEYGKLYIHMIPFVKPMIVNHWLPDVNAGDYEEAFAAVMDSLQLDCSQRNVIIAHQFLTGASRSDSEEISVGGLDDISFEVFDGIDYAALGHIHGPQRIGRDQIRYCGSPLKYSFSEEKHHKSVTFVTLREKGNVEIKTRELTPLHDMRHIRGSYQEITAREYYEEGSLSREDYLWITLTDEEDIPQVLGKLGAVYPNIMKLDYDNKRTRSVGISLQNLSEKKQNPMELFGDFYEKQNGRKMSDEQEEYLQKKMEDIWGEKK